MIVFYTEESGNRTPVSVISPYLLSCFPHFFQEEEYSKQKKGRYAPMKKKLSLVLSIALSLSLILSACGGNSGSSSGGTPSTTAPETTAPSTTEPTGGDTEITGSYTIRLGTPTGGKHQQNMTMEEFKTRIEEASGGAITVELYPTSQLGTAPQMIEGVQNGTIEGVLIPSSYFASYAPAIAILDLPFLFDADGTAAAQAQAILSAGTSLDDYLYDYGFKVGGWLLGGNSYILSTFPIEKMSDLSGHKIWTLPSPTLHSSLNAYGASPASLDPGDVAVGLQNGTVDGMLNDCTFWYTQGLYESAKNINLCPAGAFVNCFFFSADWMDTLPQNVQDLILSTAKAVVADFEVPYMTQYSEEAMQAMVDAGATKNEPSDELLAEMKAATESLHEDFKNIDSDCAAIYDEFVGLIANS